MVISEILTDQESAGSDVCGCPETAWVEVICRRSLLLVAGDACCELILMSVRAHSEVTEVRIGMTSRSEQASMVRSSSPFR
jgi:hypothetical protein